jgi:hypothetical protein
MEAFSRQVLSIIKGSWSRPAFVGRHGRNYNTFSPKALSVQFASSFAHALWTRCIFIKLRPPMPEETIETFRPTEAKADPQLQDLRRKQARWVADHIAELKGHQPVQPKTFRWRLAENWSVIFAIAEKIGGIWPGAVRQAAEKLTEQTRNEETHWTWSKRALSEMQRVLDGEPKRDSISSAAMIEILTKDPTSDWSEYLRGTLESKQSQFARLLHKAYDIPSKRVHPNKKASQTIRGWEREQFEADHLFQRHLPERYLKKSENSGRRPPPRRTKIRLRRPKM